MQHRFNRFQSFLIVAIAYSVALISGFIAIKYFVDNSLFWQIFIADIVATVVIFIFSYSFSNSSIYDPYWSVIPPFIAVFWMSHAPEDANMVRQILVLALVCIWSFRLTFNWSRGWHGLHHEDWRYGDLAAKSGKLYWVVSFFGIHLFPTILVFLGCLPLIYVVNSNSPLGIFDVLATLIVLGAICIETIADEQLRTFKKNKSGENIMKRGIWAYTRHPNYFGEISFWLGLFVFAFGYENDRFWWTIIGFLAMVVLFVFISIPMMEKRMIAKSSEFIDYKRNVSMLVPFPARRKTT